MSFNLQRLSLASAPLRFSTFHQIYNQAPASNLLVQNQMRYVLRKSTRINRRLRKYRAEKIQKEQSYNNQEALAMFYKSKSGNDNMNLQDLNQGQVKSEYKIDECFGKIKEMSKERKFDETVDVMVKLNVDPTKGDQMIRGTCVLPAGTGKEVKVCVFADPEFHSELTAAGADVIGDEQVMTDIGNGKIEFDKIICTQDHISSLKKFARILGPKGLMPNTKSGTLVRAEEIVETVQQSKMGLVEFRVNPEAFILSKVGLRSFDEDKLEANFDALMTALVERKPETIKGRYFMKGMVKTSMGPPIKVDLSKYVALASATTL